MFFVSQSSKKYQILVWIISVRLTLKQFDTTAYFLIVEMPDGKKNWLLFANEPFLQLFFFTNLQKFWARLV